MGYFKELKKLDEEFPNQVPKITDVKSVCIELKSLCTSMIVLTPWINGEGYDIVITEEKGDSRYIQLHESEVEGILRGLKHLKRI